jgi:hypothetical protein
MIVAYEDPVQRGDGWWFKRVTDTFEVWFGPYPDENNCYYNLQRLRKGDIGNLNPAVHQNLFEAPSWRQTVRDIFGDSGVEAYPPRGSRG